MISVVSVCLSVPHVTTVDLFKLVLLRDIPLTISIGWPSTERPSCKMRCKKFYDTQMMMMEGGRGCDGVVV